MTLTHMNSAAAVYGTFVGQEASCIETAALMIGTARALGLHATAQTVHTYGAANVPDAEGNKETRSFATSPEARDRLVEEIVKPSLPPGTPVPDGIATVTGAHEGPGFGGWAGHLVVLVQTDPAAATGTLYDVTFGQFAPAGMPDVVVSMNGVEMTPSSGYWEEWMDGPAQVRYAPADSPADREMEALCESLVSGYAGVAEPVAEALRHGISISAILDSLRRTAAGG